jgi:hypothetical protein
MTDLSDEENYNAPASKEGENPEPKALLRLASAPPKNSAFESTQKIHNPQVNTPIQTSPNVESQSAPAPAKVAFATKPTTSEAVPDPSISIDEDINPTPPISLIIVDVLTAAVSLAFTVLILQDILPFLK